MFQYEIKKVFSRTSSKIALFILFVILAITCWFAMDVTYVNDRGETEKGFGAARQFRETQKQWAGILDEEKLQQVIGENQRISATPQARSQDNRENDIAFSWKQGISEIRNLLNDSFAESFRSYDYYRADTVTTKDASAFYANRTTLLKTWLAEEAKEQFSHKEKEYLIRQYETLDTPFYYDYMKGWTQLFEYAPTIIMITMLVLGYLVAGVFSNEFQWKSDAIFFASFHGRNKAVRAKIKAGFCIVTAVYWIIMLLFSSIILLYLGGDGAACPIQANRSGWKSFYNILIWQKYLVIVIGGYIGCLFISFLTMLVSAKTKSAVLAVMLPFVLIFIPSFLGNIHSPIIQNILGLLPDRLLQAGTALNYFDLYGLGGIIMGSVPLLFILYSVLSILLLPLVYREYSRKQIS